MGTSRGTVHIALLCMLGASACAVGGDKLEWTGAVTQIEGSAGAGLVPWALVGGLESNDQIGGTVFATYDTTRDFSLRVAGASVDVHDRLEISFARQRFNADSVVPGTTLGQDIVGLKLRLIGDALFAPDQLLPQLALGAQYKHTLNFDDIPRAVGADKGQDIDLYLAATKLYFAAIAGRDLIINATLRRTRANQFGLLGFGGGGSAYSWTPEFSAAICVLPDLLVGAEYRDKPDNLAAFHEDSAEDAFIAWAPVKNVELTAAWTDLGRIAGKPDQRGLYVSLWLGL
jgi:hypothetical protein